MFLGIDVGARATKALLLGQELGILSHEVMDSGVDFSKAALETRTRCLASSGVPTDYVTFTLATGYGRRNVPFADATRTEISCHAKGAYFHYRKPCTVVDIGGQDSKVIKIDASGTPFSFKMNRKCAAGTGAFLEEIAARMSVPASELDTLARSSEKPVELGSFCTVFTKTEILARMAEGANPSDIARGVLGSVVKRILEMDPLTDGVVMTGGVIAHNPYLLNMFEEKLGMKPFVPPLPQFAGALGAALFAAETAGGPHA